MGRHRAADADGRAAIAVVYQAFNAYAGGVGELLGVGLFAGALDAAAVGRAAAQRGARAGLAGFAAAALLLPPCRRSSASKIRYC